MERRHFNEVLWKKTDDFFSNLMTGKLALVIPAKKRKPSVVRGVFSLSSKPNGQVQQLRTVEELRSLMVVSSNSSQLCSSCSRW